MCKMISMGHILHETTMTEAYISQHGVTRGKCHSIIAHDVPHYNVKLFYECCCIVCSLFCVLSLLGENLLVVKFLGGCEMDCKG